MRNDSFFAGPVCVCFRAVRAAALALPLALAFAAPSSSSVSLPEQPSFNDPGTITAAPGGTLTIAVGEIFDNAGTNPRFEGAGFPNPEYITGSSGLPFEGVANTLKVVVLTERELNALTSPPPATFTFTAEVTMTNDEGQYASGTLTFQTTYNRNTEYIIVQPNPPAPAPTFTLGDGPALAPPGQRIPLKAEWAFDNAGTNPRFTGAAFSTTEYYDVHEIMNGVLMVRAMTAAQLNALASPPSSPFEVTVDVTMTNDEGQTATGTITFATAYVRTVAPTPLKPSEPAGPTFSSLFANAIQAPVSQGISVGVSDAFTNAGTNPRFTKAVFSTEKYYSEHEISEYDDAWLSVTVKSAAELNALGWPPPSPFTVTVAVTMTNDEGQTATGTLKFQTTYDRESSQPNEPEPPPPIFSPQIQEHWWLLHGSLHHIAADKLFASAGTNPRITAAKFSTMEYFAANSGVSNNQLSIRVKTTAELNALATPPPATFYVDVTVTMTNDEGQTASGTLPLAVSYNRIAPEGEEEESSSLPPNTYERDVAAGGSVYVSILDKFSFGGTNRRIQSYEFSTLEHYVTSGEQGSVYTYVNRGTSTRFPKVHVTVKTAAELNALASPPPSPFTVEFTFTLTNDEGDTLDGTIRFKTTYDRVEPEEEETASEPEEAAGPIPTDDAVWTATPGELTSATAHWSFDNAGTNPVFTAAEFSTTEYYKQHYISNGLVWVEVKTAAELNAMESPPPSPFTVTVAVSMTNDEGQTASGTLTFKTTYDRVEPPSLSLTEPVSAPPGQEVVLSVSDVFANAGTNPRFDGYAFYGSTTQYVLRVRLPIEGVADKLTVQVRTESELNALASPPPATFTFPIDVTMTNDEGRYVSGTITFQTTYTRDDDSTSVPPSGLPPTERGEGAPAQ